MRGRRYKIERSGLREYSAGKSRRLLSLGLIESPLHVGLGWAYPGPAFPSPGVLQLHLHIHTELVGTQVVWISRCRGIVMYNLYSIDSMDMFGL